MFHIPDISVETFTGSPEKFNAVILVIALIAPLLARVWGSYKPMLNEKKDAHCIQPLRHEKLPELFYKVISKRLSKQGQFCICFFLTFDICILHNTDRQRTKPFHYNPGLITTKERISTPRTTLLNFIVLIKWDTK